MAGDTNDLDQSTSVAVISQASVERPLAPPALEKLTSWELFRSIGSPRLVVAPMVDASELAWRILSRLHGAELCYTPMIHAGMFNAPNNDRYRLEQFGFASGEEGDATLDRPLFAQFCANDADTLLQAAMRIAQTGKVDAVDLNLGCPQGIARRGHYGAFLMEDWALIEKLIHHLHTHLQVPITAKFRVYEDTGKTIEYAQMLERAGAQIITCHGRTRDQKGQQTGLADWRKIRAVKEAVRIPVFANGNILTHDDVQRCLEETKADGVMSAEGNLYNPALFAPIASTSKMSAYGSALPAGVQRALSEVNGAASDTPAAANPSLMTMTRRYLAIVSALRTETGLTTVRAHLFKLFQSAFSRDKHLDLRANIGAAGMGKHKTRQQRVDDYLEVVAEMDMRVKNDMAGHTEAHESDLAYWRLRPYIRPTVLAPDQVPVSVTAQESTKRPASPDVTETRAFRLFRNIPPAGHDTQAAASKMCRQLIQCPGSCQPKNLAALECSTLCCFACCQAGAACAAHERRREKQRLKKERHKAIRGERKMRKSSAFQT